MKHLWLALAMAAAAAPLAAQESSAPSVGNRDADAQLAHILLETNGQGLPVDPIVEKIRYGIITHSSPTRIVAAANAIALRLPVARDALSPGATPRGIASGQDALSHGATPGVLRAVRDASGGRRVEVPLGVLTQLLASGVSVDRAAAKITQLIRSRATDDQLLAFGDRVSDDVTRGLRPDQAFDFRLNNLTAILSPLGAAGNSAALSSSTDHGRQ